MYYCADNIIDLYNKAKPESFSQNAAMLVFLEIE